LQFGLCSPNISNPKTENSLECNFVLELAEQHFQSWTFWDTSNGFEFWNEVQKLLLSNINTDFPIHN
jgi:endoglycosylceramidase